MPTEPIVFAFNERKAVQVATLMRVMLAREATPRKLAALLYLLERESLVRRAHPISGDGYVVAADGLTLEHASAAVRLDADLGELSEWERTLMGELVERYRNTPEPALLEMLRALPEATDLTIGSAIDPASILRAAGHSEDVIEETAALAADGRFFASLASV